MTHPAFPPSHIAIINPETGRATNAFWRLLEEIWQRTGGFDSILDDSSTRDADLAALIGALQTEDMELATAINRVVQTNATELNDDVREKLDELFEQVLLARVVAGTEDQGNINDQLDSIGADHGSVLFRGADDWKALIPGALGEFLGTTGAASDPLWATPPTTTVTSIIGSIFSPAEDQVLTSGLAFATRGNIFTVEETITVKAVTASFQPVSSPSTYQAMVATLDGADKVLTVVKSSSSAFSDTTKRTHIFNLPVPAVLTSGDRVAILLVRTDAIGTTALQPVFNDDWIHFGFDSIQDGNQVRQAATDVSVNDILSTEPRDDSLAFGLYFTRVPDGSAQATEITYDPTASGLAATDVQAAIDEVDTTLDNLTTTDVAEGTNLYFTTARFDAEFSLKSTTDLSEGTNLYFTNERAQDAVGSILTDTATIDLTYDDAGNTITADVKDDSTTNAKLATMAANRIKGAVVAGNPVDLTPLEIRGVAELDVDDVVAFARLNIIDQNAIIDVQKSTTTDDARIAYKTGTTTHAEVGLLGTDDFIVNVSADGVAFKTGLYIKGTNGFVGLGIVPAALLDLRNATAAKIRLSRNASGEYSVNIPNDQTATVAHTFLGVGVAILDQSAIPSDGVSPALVRYFRNTTTTGVSQLDVHTADGTSNVNCRLSANSNSFLQFNSGNLIVGGSSPIGKFRVQTGGSVFGNPTGGDQGTGSINAQAVFDDNVLLTCYIGELMATGSIDEAYWDTMVPNSPRVPGRPAISARPGVAAIPATETEPEVPAKPEILEEPEILDIPEKIRIHDPLRKFMARLGGPEDPMDIDKYWAHFMAKGHLTSLQNKAHYDPLKPMSVGECTQRLIETVEIQAVHIENLNQRLKLLETP